MNGGCTDVRKNGFKYMEILWKNQILQIMSKIDDTLPWEDFYRGELCTKNVHQGTVFSVIILMGKYLTNKYSMSLLCYKQCILCQHNFVTK